MRLIADVHGAAAALRKVAVGTGPLLVLGDLINFIDYRTNDGILADVSGLDFVTEIVELRTRGEYEASADRWREHASGREEQLRADYDERVEAAYVEICAALGDADAYVTYGNVDRPESLRDHLPRTARYVDAEVVDIEGIRVGFAGGGITSLGTPGEVTEEEMAAKLEQIGPVEMLCTHVPPAVRPLAIDVLGGRAKGSAAVLDYLGRHRPAFHYFGDIHQPMALSWRVGETMCRNVGYFRGTGNVFTHEV
ncbi:MAG TPA: metallophosphoesterase [Acidimicrobiia bacterium]